MERGASSVRLTDGRAETPKPPRGLRAWVCASATPAALVTVNTFHGTCRTMIQA